VADPGWYPDVYWPGALRYWSGTSWTDHVVVRTPQRPAPVSFTQAIRICFGKFVTWRGRAGLAEYWWWYLFAALCWLPFIAASLAVFILSVRPDGSVAPGAWFAMVPIVLAYALLLLPTISVSIRRLHDTDRSGAWELLELVPYGNIVLVVFHVLGGTPGPNQYGPVPGHEA